MQPHKCLRVSVCAAWCIHRAKPGKCVSDGKLMCLYASTVHAECSESDNAALEVDKNTVDQ